jgi:chromosome segregation ATPase
MFVAGCDTSENETSANNSEAAAPVDSDLESRIEAYRVAMQQQIGRLDRQIELLEDDASQLESDTREVYDATMQEIKEERDELELAIVELEASTMAAWDELKSGLDGSWEDLEQAVAAAGRQFGIGGPDPQSPRSPNMPEN